MEGKNANEGTKLKQQNANEGTKEQAKTLLLPLGYVYHYNLNTNIFPMNDKQLNNQLSKPFRDYQNLFKTIQSSFRIFNPFSHSIGETLTDCLVDCMVT